MTSPKPQHASDVRPLASVPDPRDVALRAIEAACDDFAEGNVDDLRQEIYRLLPDTTAAG